MAIRITRNEEGNCITFVGSSNPAYWNACLSAQINADDATRVDIINDIRSQNEESTQYEFYAVSIDDFADKDGNSFADAQAMVDYVNENANVIGVSSVGTNLNGIAVNFRLDDTSTSIIMDNGSSFGVNTIKAVADADGTIHIHAIGAGVPEGSDEPNDHKYFEGLEVGNVLVNGVTVAGGIQDVVNTLNELFTVGAFESVVISDPYSTLVADVDGVDADYTLEGSTAVDPSGDDIFSNSSTGNYAGLKSTATINQAGEYFTFDIRGEGQIGFGLVHSDDSYSSSFYSGNANYADPATFGVSNSAHYGFQFSHWFHPTPNGSWTNYGANTGFVRGSGWYNWESQDDWLAGDPVKIRVGIDENGYIAISSLQDDNTTWVLHARSSYPVTEGAEFHLGIKAANSDARVFSDPKVHLLEEDDTPTSIGDTNIDAFGSTTGTLASSVTVSDASGDNDGFITAEVLDASGEYFEVEVNENKDHLIGLFYENDYDVATVQADTDSWSKGKYMFFGGRINTNEQLTTSVYKNESGSTIGSTVLQRPIGCTHFRIGFDTQGRATIWSSTDGVNFVPSLRHVTAAPSGNYKLIWVADSNGATFESLTSGALTSAPVLNFRYIESPDGEFQYPLFATEEEANYYDQNHDGTTGSGTSHQHVFADDPTNTSWYMPDTGSTMTGTAAPTTTFMGQTVTYTEITSLTDADLVPPAFSAADLTVDELTTVNYQTQPAGTAYTTSITGLPSGLTDGGAGMITGTAPEVTSDMVTNPSDTYTITVTRTNSYGSSTGTFDIIVNNLTQVPTTIAGFTHIAASATMVDGDTLADGSAVTIDNALEDGKRIVFSRSWMETYVRDTLQTGTNQKVFIGIADSSANWSSIDTNDFVYGYQFEKGSTSNGLYVRRIRNRSVISNVTYSVFANDLVFFHDHSVSGYMLSNLPNGGQGETVPTPTYTNNGWSGVGSGDQTFVIAVVGTTMDLSTSGITEVDNPVISSSLTPWTKALDFSGSSERIQQVDAGSNYAPLKMGGLSQTVGLPSTAGQTSNSTYSRPWATAIVFKADGNSSNQHIWNCGEGAGSNDDNIYLRMDASRNLYFGWGRTGALNEVQIGFNLSTAQWYGVYVASTGTRLSGSNATPNLLQQCFDIRFVDLSTGAVGSNLSTYANWSALGSTTGGRMDRQITGGMFVGGRGANRNFHGKVASMVVTTLLRGVNMPSDAEISMMVRDPQQWMTDYKVGNAYRRPAYGSSLANWQRNSSTPAYATQVWLMGDGQNDGYAQIRNNVYPAIQNIYPMNMISMVSNDIQTVNINGLT